MNVCIIGAGSSGIVTAKTLSQSGIDFDCYEKGSFIGGVWKYNNDNNLSSAYKSLHINTSKQMMSFSDFPMPDNYPDYPHHSLIFDYFNEYVDHFDIRKKIQFNTAVEKVEKIGTAEYLVSLSNKKQIKYNAVIVCNGHHWKPKYPNFEGTFNGKVLHAHYYKTPNEFENKRVLIVGIGNSAVDIACELSSVAQKVVISTRSSAYIIPKYLFGIPTDHISKPPLAFLPLEIQRLSLKTALLLNIGNQENYGVPIPKRPLLTEHPTISQDFLSKVGHGKIKITGNIKSFNENLVIFENNNTEEFDTIIFATGYQISFPFFNENFIPIKDNDVSFYHKVVSTNHENLFFIGLIQPLGAIMPLAEIQAKWVSKLLNKEVILPPKETMEKTIKKDKITIEKRYVKSNRHTIQVDFYPYKKLIEDEIKTKRILKNKYSK
jgi:thioredoxin reductase